MKPAYEVAAVRAAEAELMATLPKHTLMQRAAYGLSVQTADLLQLHTGGISGRIVLGLIGSGNNGSDSLWAMSYLAKRGVKCFAIDVTKRRNPDISDQHFADSGGAWIGFEEAEKRLKTFAAMLDGIAGLASSRPVETKYIDLAHRLRQNAPVIAVDVPSGLDADGENPETSGAIPGDVTVTFGCLKPCHVFDPFAQVCGEVRLIHIGLELPLARIWQVDDEDVIRYFDTPHVFDNKYSRGVVAVAAGSEKYPGAGVLAIRAARWGGAGMVQQIGGAFSVDTPSVVMVSDFAKASRVNAWLVGPGLAELAEAAVDDVLPQDGIIVLDADALNVISEDRDLQNALVARKGITILTPHGGEAKRLAKAFDVEFTGVAARDACALARATNCVVYLKGSIGTIALPNGQVLVTHRTCEHLATAGSGDVLAGFATSMLAHHRPNDHFEAARIMAAAVIVHSIAAESIAVDGEPVIADEIEQQLPAAIAQLSA